MNQEKIGKFILELRKEKGMTQQTLANILGVSDKTISKWENGRGMPDLSLMKPLCSALDITINELLSGERILSKDYQEKLEENILNTINYTDIKLKKTKRIFKVVVGLILFIVVLFGTMCFIDIRRMQQNKPVLFSTWGFSYSPAIEIEEAKIYQAIKEYLNNSENESNEKTFISMRVYLLEEKVKDKKFYVYAWVNGATYYLENNELKKDSASSIPYKFVVENDNGKYLVTDFSTPRDGSYYTTDMKNIFPRSVRKDMENVYFDGTSAKLDLEIEEQAKLYFHK